MVSPIPSRRPCITFLTDFGMRDTYVAQMKGVALGINPDAHLVDLTHEIPPQQVLRAAYVWNDAISAFPASTIHVGVVDPGVGSHRRLVAAEIGDQKFVCPDNGLLTLILANASIGRVVTLNNPQWWRDGVSNTFHGRDILTPSLRHGASDTISRSWVRQTKRRWSHFHWQVRPAVQRRPLVASLILIDSAI